MPHPLSAAPQCWHRVSQVDLCNLWQCRIVLPRSILPRHKCGFWLHWLTSQARYVRVSLLRRAMHAFCESPYWVGTGRVALRYVSPCPPLDPYVRLSPHTAHDRGILRERSISPTPRYILHGQLCAFVGYLCTVSLPSPSGPSPCTRLSRIRTTMPYLTACRASELSVRVSPAYFPLSLTSLSGSPVFRMKDSNEMM